MDRVIGQPAFLGNLDMRLLTDVFDAIWQHLSRFGYRDKDGNEYWCEIGDTTNFCSVPDVPGVYEVLGNRARKSGAIHDKLYTGLVPREKADELLREMLVLNGMSKCEAEEFYLAVRAFGGPHYVSPQASPTTPSQPRPAEVSEP